MEMADFIFHLLGIILGREQVTGIGGQAHLQLGWNTWSSPIEKSGEQVPVRTQE